MLEMPEAGTHWCQLPGVPEPRGRRRGVGLLQRRRRRELHMMHRQWGRLQELLRGYTQTEVSSHEARTDFRQQLSTGLTAQARAACRHARGLHAGAEQQVQRPRRAIGAHEVRGAIGVRVGELLGETSGECRGVQESSLHDGGCAPEASTRGLSPATFVTQGCWTALVQRECHTEG